MNRLLMLASSIPQPSSFIWVCDRQCEQACTCGVVMYIRDYGVESCILTKTMRSCNGRPYILHILEELHSPLTQSLN